MKSAIALLSLLLVAAGCVSPSAAPTDGTLSVVTSFYPIGEFARQVGGGRVRVEVITPAGTEPHDYEPTARQVAAAYASDVFLFNGGGVDAWAEKISGQASENGARVAEMASAIDTLPAAEGDEESDAQFDPHFWLDPELAKREVELIRDTLTAADPAYAETYAANATAYAATLDRLDDAYRSGLSSCANPTVVSSHATLAYVADAYGFDVISISGLSPEEEPSAGRIASIAELAKEKKIEYIYFETLVSPRIAETIAEEIGAMTLVFNPLEGLTQEETAAGKTYVSVMEDNLTNLKTGMMCE